MSESPRPTGPFDAVADLTVGETAHRERSGGSYHDAIQLAARVTELERTTVYDNNGETRFSFRELEYLTGALHKILRVMNTASPAHKTLDDTIDSYNYLALFYESISRRLPRQKVLD